jgi:hypothetical protein
MDLQAATPDLSDSASVEVTPASITATVRGPQADQRVSGNFKSIGLAEFTTWLEGQGVSFVIGDDVKTTRRVTLNIKDQPLDQTVDAVLDALGLRADRRGDVFVVKPGNNSTFTFGRALAAPHAPSLPAEVFELRGLKGLPDGIRIEELQKRAGEHDRQANELIKGLDSIKIEARALDAEKFGEDLAKQLKDGKAFNGKDGEKFAKEMAKMAKELAETFRSKKFTDQLRGNLDSMIELKRLRADELGSAPVESVNLEKLVKSLTPAQKALQKKRGFLTPDDLTATQRKWIPTARGGKFQISVSTNSGTLTLKNP